MGSVNLRHLTSHELIGIQNQTFFVLLRDEITLAGSCWLRASSGVLSHRSSCLLIAHVASLRNSRSNPERALCESRLHFIVYHYFQLTPLIIDWFPFVFTLGPMNFILINNLLEKLNWKNKCARSFLWVFSFLTYFIGPSFTPTPYIVGFSCLWGMYFILSAIHYKRTVTSS